MNNYIITEVKEGKFQVWYEDYDNPDRHYTVDLKQRTCTCPHFYFRCRLNNANCRHIELVKRFQGRKFGRKS